jgi:hypothetical protein
MVRSVTLSLELRDTNGFNEIVLNLYKDSDEDFIDYSVFREVD